VAGASVMSSQNHLTPAACCARLARILPALLAAVAGVAAAHEALAREMSADAFLALGRAVARAEAARLELEGPSRRDRRGTPRDAA
jgi:hypothetical protein